MYILYTIYNGAVLVLVVILCRIVLKERITKMTVAGMALQRYYIAGEATNPIFEVFYLENAHGVIADFSGNPPYEF